MKYRYVTFEGNIGAGKTTFTKEMAKRWNARMVLEQFEDNPFLSSFYTNPDKYGFALEMSFLAERYQQLSKEVQQTELFAERIISDYAPYKSLIFANQTLDSAEYGVYKKMHQLLYTQLPNPDLVIYLHRPIEVLMKNIAQRGRDYEQQISADYLQKIEEGYFKFFRNRPDLVTIVIEPKEENFAFSQHFQVFIEGLMEMNWSPGRHIVEES